MLMATRWSHHAGKRQQSRSIYRKLNVSSRWDAVAQLEQSGFYDEAELAV